MKYECNKCIYSKESFEQNQVLCLFVDGFVSRPDQNLKCMGYLESREAIIILNKENKNA